jgi:hypothetical protein
MSTKKSARFITLAAGAEMRLQLDPDIYDTDTTLILGISTTLPANAKVVPVTVRQAANSSSASFIRCRVSKGAVGSESEEFRVVKLLCEASKRATAITALEGKTLQLGGAVTSSWTIRSVS